MQNHVRFQDITENYDKTITDTMPVIVFFYGYFHLNVLYSQKILQKNNYDKETFYLRHCVP